MNIYDKGFKLIIGAIILFAFSICHYGCEEINTKTIKTSEYYIGTSQDETFVLKFETISQKKITGKRYVVDNTAIAKEEDFSVTIRHKKCSLQINGQDIDGKFVPDIICEDSITCEFSNNNENRKYCFRKYRKPEFKAYEAQFEKEKYKVETIRDVVYGKAKGFWSYNPEKKEPFTQSYIDKLGELIKYNISPQEVELKLDIYLPQDDTCKARPLLMLIHGGAFFNGDKASEAYVKWSNHFAAMGFVVASINYRMGFLPSANQIDCAGYRAAQDANAAMRYMVHNASKYRINTNWIFAGGTSAGAITSLNLAFMRNGNRPKSTKGTLLKKDLGDIESVSPQYKEKFSIKAVANMWGAVHDISMISNAKTSIISFHGDADNIVPYGYDYPFKIILDELKVELKSDNLGMAIPVNEIISNKMYGSSIIDKNAKSLGNKSKLFTYPGGGHSLHVDKNNNLVPYFYFIQDSVTAFFVEEIIPDPISISQDSKDKSVFHTNSKDIKDLRWKADNGIILESDQKHAKIIFLGNSDKSIYVSGHYSNGISFLKKFTL